jgi:hypothetical protein
MLVVLAVIGIFTSLFLTGSVIVFETQFGGITARVSRKKNSCLGLSNKINTWCINQAHVSRTHVDMLKYVSMKRKQRFESYIWD